MNKKLIEFLAEQSNLRQFKMMGFSRRQLDILEEGDFSDQGEAETYYYYSGPNDDKTRPFCKELLAIDKFYRASDLNRLSAKVGYDVLEHAGSFNCRHTWRTVRARMKQDTPSKGQIDRAAVKQPSNVQNYLPFILPFPKED